MNSKIEKGMRVLVTHLQGEEEGVVESVNFKSQRVLVYFDYPACPHFDSFMLKQVTILPNKPMTSLA